MTAKLTQPVKWHGGKHYLAPKIVALMPDDCLHYVEPYFGGGSVLLAKDAEGCSEVVNDRNGPLTNFWRVLQCPRSFEMFIRNAQATPFSEDVWQRACEKLAQPCKAPDTICISCGYCFFICCRQSLAGRMTDFATLSRTRTRRRMNEQASAWLTAVEGLPAVHKRLQRVVILNRDALEVIRQQDGEKTLFYLDPPYLHETRATTGEYAFEMTAEQHHELLCLIRTIRGKVMLSGYRSKMYDEMLAGWKRHDFELPNNAAAGESKRRMTECLWVNF
jgi:DNA adenine methylase